MITYNDNDNDPDKPNTEEPKALVEPPKGGEPSRAGRNAKTYAYDFGAFKGWLGVFKGWVRSNLLLLAIIAVQGYTLTEVQATKRYAGRAAESAHDASNYAAGAEALAELAAERAGMAEYHSNSNGDELINIDSNLRFNQYSVQCSEY